MSNETIRYFQNNKPPNLESDKFYDNDFPPNEESIFGFNCKKDSEELKNREEWEIELKKLFGMDKNQKFQWERIFSSSKFTLSKKPDKASVIQGAIGDCYFISYLHAIKERCPEIYTSLIRNIDIEKGYIEVNFFKRNEDDIIEEEIVYVDDYIPCINGYPIFSYHNNVKIKFDKYFEYDKNIVEKFYVGSYMLLEKAFAKLNGSYYNIIGNKLKVADPFFALTGRKINREYFRNIFVSNSNDNIKNKYNLEIKEEIKGKTDKEIEEKIKELEIKRQKEKEQIIKELKKEDKEKIIEYFQSLLKKNVCAVASESKYSSGDITKFGIHAWHQYHLRNIQTEKSKSGNQETFIYLWNPHGYNPNPENIYYPYENKTTLSSIIWSPLNSYFKEKGYYKYEDFDNINAYNEKGFEDGNIILNIDRFFYAFQCILYHDENEFKINLNKVQSRKSIFNEFFKDEFARKLFIKMFGLNYYIIFIIYLIQTAKNKSKDKSEIFKQAKNSVQKVNIVENNVEKQIQLYEENEYIEIKENLKNEILNKANEIMKEKCKSNFKENDMNNITKILINENNNNNEKYKLLVEENDTEFLKEINKEIKSKAKKFAQNFNMDKSDIKQKYIEQINFSNSPKVDNQVPYYKNGTIIIRSSLGNKNLHIQHNEIKSETPLILFDAHGGNAQRFFLVNNNDGTVSFEKDDFAIDIKSSLMSQGTIIQLNEKNYKNNQKFILKKREDDLVSIHSSIDDNYVIDVYWAKTDNFNQIQLWTWNATKAQKFKFIYV